MSHIETVKGMYEAFGRGDVPAILACLAEDVEWEYGVNSTEVPWFQPRRGRANIGAFFESLQAIEFHTFTPTRLLGDSKVVVALVDLEFTVKSTGKRVVEVDEVHIWWFNDKGEVQRFRHRADTHQQALALKP
jgi:ketosteroid isomerase-like protein